MPGVAALVEPRWVPWLAANRTVFTLYSLLTLGIIHGSHQGSVTPSVAFGGALIPRATAQAACVSAGALLPTSFLAT